MADGLLLATAFSAGVATVFSPCATAVLPAYLSYYVSRPDTVSAAGPESERPKLLIVGIVAAIAGVALLIFALLDWVLTLGSAGGTAAGLAGGFAFVLGAFLASEAAKPLGTGERSVLRAQIFRGIAVGAMVSIGIAAVYLGIGLAANLGASRFPTVLPWVAFAAAFVLLAVGTLLFFGRDVLSFVPRVRAPSGRGVRSFLLFGVAYGLISTGCGLPVFFSLLLASLPLGLADAAQVMLMYAAGSAIVFVSVSASAGAAQGVTFQTLRAWRPHVHRVAGAIVVLMAAYVLWYDWTFLLSRSL